MIRGSIGVVLVLAGAACMASGSPPASSDWPLPNRDLAGTRAVSIGSIDAESVGRLQPAWRFRFGISPRESGVVTATPVVAGGTVYAQDMESNVFALDLDSGALVWTRRFHAGTPGPNGLAVDETRVYGSTDTTIFALSRDGGRLLWRRRMLTAVEHFIDIAPVVVKGLVYTSTVGYPPGGRGSLYALDASTGEVRWRFSTIRDPWRHPTEAGGGGAWFPPTADESGTLYWGVANPAPWGGTRSRPNGGAFPGPALYTDSLLALDGRTGQLRWYDQVTPHDIRDYDFQLPPILARVARGGRQRDFVYGAGKAGLVIAWDRETHRRVWQTAVGLHRNDTGPLPRRMVSVCPGLYGGVETPMAYADGRLFIPVVELCARGSATGYEPLEKLDPARGRGLLVAISAASGRRLWMRRLPQPTFGCATVARDVVFTSTFDGRLYGFRVKDGTLLWSDRMRAGVNACPAIARDTLLVAAGLPRGSDRSGLELVAYRLG